MFIKRIASVSILCSLAVLCLASYGDGVVPKDSSKFLKSVYVDVFAHRNKYSSSRAKKHRVLEVMFKSVVERLPSPFSSFNVMSQKYWRITIEREKKGLPILFNRKDKSCLNGFNALPPLTPITVYVDLQYKKKNKKKHFFLELVGFDYLRAKIQDLDDGKKEFKEKDYIKIKPRRIDIQTKLFVNRKVRFDVKFKGISKNIPGVLLKGGVNPSKVFLLKVDDLWTSVLVDKNNSQCVETIIDANINDTITIYATLRKFEFDAGGRSARVYYLVPVSISNDTKVTDLQP